MSYKIPFGICVFFILFYTHIARYQLSTDTIAATILPITIIRGQGFYLDKTYPYLTKTLPSQTNSQNLPYFLSIQSNHHISIYPVFSSLISVPIYLLPVLFKKITLDNLSNFQETIMFLGTLSASTFTAISVAIIFASLVRSTNKLKAFTLTIIYAIGTSTLSISSRSLWQHSASQMFLTLSIYFFIIGQKEKKFLAFTGLFLGFATLSRFVNGIIAIPFLIYLAAYERKQLANFIILAIPSIVFFAWYQIAYQNNLFFYKYDTIGSGGGFDHPLLKGILGLLIAPSKGLFIYSPIFILSMFGAILAWKNKDRIIVFFTIIIFLFIIVNAKYNGWQGGWSFGPRMLTDITPFLVYLLVPLMNSSFWDKKVFKLLFFILALISISIHILGALVWDTSWYGLQSLSFSNIQVHKDDFLWSLRYPELLYFYLHTGGFFGILSLFSRALLDTFFKIIINLCVILFFYFTILILLSKVKIKFKKSYFNNNN